MRSTLPITASNPTYSWTISSTNLQLYLCYWTTASAYENYC